MHVVHLETGRHLYGGAQQVLYLLRGLPEHGVQSTLVCPPDSKICVAAERAGVSVQPMPMGGDLDAGFARRLKLWLEIQQPDLLHVHSRRGADLWGGLAARQAGVTAVLSRRVDNPDFPFIGRVKYRLYERVIAISEEIRSQLHVGGVANSKVDLVYSAVDAAACQPSRTRAQFRDMFGIADDELVVVNAAQLIERKGQKILLKAWRAVLEGYQRARLILFGQGPDEEALQDEIERLGLTGSVTIAGFRDDLLSYLGHADLMVHPATQEGLGVCLLEAQAAGVPIVASRAGGDTGGGSGRRIGHPGEGW